MVFATSAIYVMISSMFQSSLAAVMFGARAALFLHVTSNCRASELYGRPVYL